MHSNDPVIDTTAGKLSLFNRSQILKKVFWFALITIAGMAAVFFYSNTGKTMDALSRIRPVYILICLSMLSADLLLGGWRNHIFVRKIAPHVSSWTSFRANTANMFMGAITPGHSGAGPAQIYIYMRGGLGFTGAFAISLINMAATLIFMPVAALTALLLIDHRFGNGMIPALLKYGFCFFLVFLLLFILAFIRPLWVGSAIRTIARWIVRLAPRRERKIQAWAEKTYENISRYSQICRVLLHRHAWLFPLSTVITILLYLNKYCMQWVILAGLGIHADPLQVMAVQVLIQFMIYFAPSPGGSGFAEAGIAVLFYNMVPAAVMPVFILLQRAFLLFIPAIVGAFVVIGSAASKRT